MDEQGGDINEIFKKRGPGPGHDIVHGIAAHNEQHKGGWIKPESKHVIRGFKGVSRDGNTLHFEDKKPSHRNELVGKWSYNHKKGTWKGHKGVWEENDGRVINSKDSTWGLKHEIKHDKMLKHLKTHQTSNAKDKDKAWQLDQPTINDVTLGGLM